VEELLFGYSVGLLALGAAEVKMDQVVLFHDVQGLLHDIAADGKGGLTTITSELHDSSPKYLIKGHLPIK
jgi:hypothetical protein